MKKAISFVLAALMLVSAVPTALATNDYTQGTQVVYTATGSESYTITVPASLNPGQSGTVTLDGYWPDSKTVTVTAEKTVTLKNSIKAADTKTLNVTFLGISEAGSNTSKQTFTEPVSVEGISNALFGTWSGKFNYNVDSTEEEVVPPSENYIGTVSTDNTITLSGVESAGTYTLRYANANGALENYADICSLEVTDPATAVSYDDLIAENCAPVEATSIAVYNASNEKVGDIALGGLKTNLGTKLYGFGALADIHIGSENSVSKTNAALSYLAEKENVDFVCIPGDLTEKASTEQLTELKSIIDAHSSNTPIYVSTGNHDGLEYIDDISIYTNNPLYYSFTKGNDVFIMIGNIGNGEDSLFEGGALGWLYETLEANKNKRCFVFQHVRPDEGCGNANGLYANDVWGGINATIFENIMGTYPNAIFFHGHSHLQFALQSIDDMANYDNLRNSHSVHIPSVTKPRGFDGQYDTSMSEGYAIDVYENGIILRGIDLVNQMHLPIAQYHLDTAPKAANSTLSNPIPVSYEWLNKTTIDKNTGVESPNETYAASTFIKLEEGVTYTVYEKVDWGLGAAIYVCYYQDGTFLRCETLWKAEDAVGAYEKDIPFVEGATHIRLRHSMNGNINNFHRFVDIKASK